MPLKGQLVIESDWKGWGKEIVDDLAAANTAAMHRTVDGIKRDMRQAIQAAGLGRRLGFTIGSEVYPKAGKSLEPAGVLRSRGKSAENILRSYLEGTTIKGKRGWLAIPVRKNLPVLGRNTKPTPELVEQRLGRPLRWVKARGRSTGLLVADSVTRGKTGKRVSAYGRDRTRGQRRSGRPETLVMFILVRQVQVRKRLEFAPLVQRWIDQLPRLVAAGTRT